jgi:hypothetical protein
LVLAGLAILLAIGMASPFLAYTVDDSFITYHYGQNLSAGLGPVFNVGERVEGYTSFSWMLLMAASLAIGLDPIVVSKVLGMLSTLAAGAMVFWSAFAVSRRPWQVGFIALFLLVLNAEVAVNSTSGLESTFFMFWIAAAMARDLWEQRRASFPWSSLLFGVAALTRPEGIAFFGLHILFQAIVLRPKPARLLLPVGLFLLVVLPHWLWRLAYYGQLLPATYYAKQSSLLYRLVTGGFYVFPFLIMFLVVLVAALRLRQKPSRYLVWMTLGGIAIAWWEGGDWMIGHRFLLPVVPAWSLLAADTVSSLYDRLLNRAGNAAWTPARRNLAMGLIAAALLVLNVGQAVRFRQYTSIRAAGYERAHLALAYWLDERYDAGRTVALTDVGMIGYYSGLRIVDLTGLTDITIARAPGDIMDKVYNTSYILDQEPAVVVLVSLDDDLIPDFACDRRLYDDEHFQAAYELDHTLEHYRDSWLGVYTLLVFVRRAESDVSAWPGAS